MRAFMNGRKFKEFDSFLYDPKKCERVIAVGHSLGGSLALLMAACANRPDSDAAISKKVNLTHFKVHELFTFGACGVAEEFITNHMESQPHHCFPGARFYMEKYSRKRRHYIDPIPNLGSFRPVSRVRHPKTDVFALTESVGENIVYREVFRCNTSVADTQQELPKAQEQAQAPWGQFAGTHNYHIHNTKYYNNSLAQILELE